MYLVTSCQLRTVLRRRRSSRRLLKSIGMTRYSRRTSSKILTRRSCRLSNRMMWETRLWPWGIGKLWRHPLGRREVPECMLRASVKRKTRQIISRTLTCSITLTTLWTLLSRAMHLLSRPWDALHKELKCCNSVSSKVTCSRQRTSISSLTVKETCSRIDCTPRPVLIKPNWTRSKQSTRTPWRLTLMRRAE